MKKRLLALSVLSALLPATVWASASPAPFNFSGPYIGFNLGASSVTDHASYGTASGDFGTAGFAYDGVAGYGWQFPSNWYVGGELGIGNTTGSATAALDGFSVTESQNYSFTADAKAGRVVGDSTLVYGKVGYAHTDFHQSSTITVAPTQDVSFDGLRLGGGLETQLVDNLTGNVEGIYTSYADQTNGGVKDSVADVGVRFGLSYYFR